MTHAIKTVNLILIVMMFYMFFNKVYADRQSVFDSFNNHSLNFNNFYSKKNEWEANSLAIDAILDNTVLQGVFDRFASFKMNDRKVLHNKICLGNPGKKLFSPSPNAKLDPNRELPGIGFKQRRDDKLIPEDPLVLEWLKQVQDVSSADKKLLPSMEKENNEAQTFNNALVAMAFIIEGERERAERILDFYASATVRDNSDPGLQNFFYKGEARGFFQHVYLNSKDGILAYHTPIPTSNKKDDDPKQELQTSDRWMGDMVWLFFAYKYYKKTYNSDRYAEINKLIKDLLISWYKDAPDGPGGYIQHGWRKGDTKLHEDNGHHEGNIDCYAMFKLIGEDAYAERIKIWLERVLPDGNLPLDLYTWRVLAFGSDYAPLLDIPDYDLRYRKTLRVKDKLAMGFYNVPDSKINNIWLDGTGHIACAYFAIGNIERGNFYANQLDAFLIDREISGVKTRSIPYTANKDGGYDWVELDKGFVSVAAWYIFAKNKFNPLTLTVNK